MDVFDAQLPARVTLAGELGLDPASKTLELALTHRSFAYENGGLPHNERLEFLGDSVLGVVVTDELYKRFPDYAEGTLARIRAAVVNMRALAGLSRNLGVGPCLYLGRGEETTGGRDKSSILADCMEALIGAVYLDLGMHAADGFVRSQLVPLVEKAATCGAGLDWKTSLQELTAKHGLGVPRYEIVATGPDHAKEFAATAVVSDKPLGSGSGRSKKVAEQQAAEQAWRSLADSRGETAVPPRD